MAVVFAALYTWGAIYYAKNNQIDRIVAGIQDPKQDMSQYVTPSTPDLTVTNETVKPLQRYFKTNKKAAKVLAKNLRAGKDSRQIKLVQSGRYYLLYPKYTLRIQVYHPQVETNHGNSTLKVDKNNLGQMQGAGQNYYTDLGLRLPGRYHLVVNTKVSGRQLEASSVVNIWSGKTINMNIKTGTFQIRSVPNGVVYINDKKVKQLGQNGQATFKNYPLAKHMELYITTKYKGKTVRSETVKDLSTSISSEFSNSDDNVNDYGETADYAGNEQKDVYQDVEGDYIVNPIWTGLIDKEEAGHLLYSAYLKPNKNNFVDGKNNTSYQKLIKTVKKFKKNKKDIHLTVRIMQILPAGKNYSQVDYQLVYKYQEKGKKHTETVNYRDALFHNMKEVQKIKSLGQE